MVLVHSSQALVVNVEEVFRKHGIQTTYTSQRLAMDDSLICLHSSNLLYFYVKRCMLNISIANHFEQEFLYDDGPRNSGILHASSKAIEPPVF